MTVRRSGAEPFLVPTLQLGNRRQTFWLPSCRFDPVTARRFRLLVREAKDNVSRIWEAEL
ncbi:MAG: hypothetical protein PHN77_05855 [Thermoguttaceae bacterium]|nr:hypothetical protein [Thermoguttaceae bacterium]MDI9446954.1 hypothetical protein [Planctomycetota bacterium]